MMKKHHNNTGLTDEVLRRLEEGEITISKAFSLLNQPSSSLESNPRISNSKETTDQSSLLQLEELMAELDSLVGLKQVKRLINEYQAFVEIQKRRRHTGLKAEPLVMHMVFKGNPGTGKTTVARILAKIFKEIGVLEKGHLVETERADLVGEYIGHTAQKTRKVIQKALGGVLFIDEAYALARGGERDFGKETIDTLVKALEDHKESLIVILAGYRKEMEDFIITNPGLRSRFPLQLDFEDYTMEELVAIGEKLAADKDYVFTPKAKAYLYRILSMMLQNGSLNAGNARTVRNIIEKAIRLQAVRLLDQEEYRRTELMSLRREDLEKGVEACPDV